jgi:hypothetical protein
MNRLTLAALAAGALCAGAAQAQHHVFRFTGTISEATGPTPVAVGQTFEFRYRFDTQTPDQDPFPNFGQYTGAIVIDAVFSTPTYQLSAVPGDISILNNGFAGDTYTANIANPIQSAQVGLGDLQGTVFNDDSLPGSLNLGDFEIKRVYLHGDVGPTFWDAAGEITGFLWSQVDCYADCNNDGFLNLADFGCFQTKFALGDMYADCNGDLVLNLADFGCFQTKFALGCP